LLLSPRGAHLHEILSFNSIAFPGTPLTLSATISANWIYLHSTGTPQENLMKFNGSAYWNRTRLCVEAKTGKERFHFKQV